MADKPTVFIEYSHDSAAHQRRVLTLAKELQQHGIDCRLDQLVKRPRDDWEHWFAAELDAARTVVVVCTRTLARRLAEAAGGEGNDWEAKLLDQCMRGEGRPEVRFIAVLLEGATDGDVPPPIQRARRYRYPEQQSELWRSLGEPLPVPPTTLMAEIDELRKRVREIVLADGDPTELLRTIEEKERLRDFGPAPAEKTMLEGRYELVEKVGGGGVAEVWRAYDEKEPAMTAAFLLLGDDLPLDDAVFNTIRFVRSLPCSIWVKAVLHRSLSRLESDRYDSVREFCKELEKASQLVEPPVAASLEVVIITRDGMRTFPLPEHGRISIGRNSDNDIPTDETEDAVSGRHAYLYIDEQ